MRLPEDILRLVWKKYYSAHVLTALPDEWGVYRRERPEWFVGARGTYVTSAQNVELVRQLKAVFAGDAANWDTYGPRHKIVVHIAGAAGAAGMCQVWYLSGVFRGILGTGTFYKNAHDQWKWVSDAGEGEERVYAVTAG